MSLGCSGVLALLRGVTRHCHPALPSWQPEGEPETGPDWELTHRRHLSFFENTLLNLPGQKTLLLLLNSFCDCANHPCSFQDHGNSFTYTGSGGRDLSGNKRTAEQSCDQKLTNMNRLATFVLPSTLSTWQAVSTGSCCSVWPVCIQGSWLSGKRVKIGSGLWLRLQISCTMGMLLSVHWNGAEL